MTRKQHLRRVAITCLHCLRNLAYFRSGPNEAVLKTKGDFWISANNNFLDIFVLEWCKLFGDKRGKHYWEKIISDKQAFFSSMLQKLKIDIAELVSDAEKCAGFKNSGELCFDMNIRRKFPWYGPAWM